MKNIKIKLLSLALILFISSSQALAKIEITWFGTTTFNISDGKTAIFFDPFVTRPGLWSIATFKSEKSNIFHVKRWLKKIDQENIKAIFVSHTHYDHAFDLVNFHKETGAMVYGSHSAKNILLGGKVDKKYFTHSKVNKTFKIGNFKITVLNGEHPSHFLGMTFWYGKIEAPLPEDSALYKYKQGEVYNYYIEHPEMNIFFHPSGVPVLKKKDLENKKARVVIQGIAKRESSEGLLSKIIRPLAPKYVIPAHHDYFFQSLEDGFDPMPSVDPEEFRKTLLKQYKGVIVPQLIYGKRFIIEK